MRHIILGFIAAAAVVGAACGGAKSANPADGAQTQAASTTATPSPQSAAPPSAPAQAPAPTATAVEFEQLIALLPDAPSGWTKGKPKGNQVGMGIGISTAEADYERGESSVHLEITDTAFDRTYLAPLSFTLASHYSERHSSGYSKSETIGASPGFEKWDGDAKSAEVTMLVGNRMIVTAKGRNVDNVDGTRTLVAAVDQGKLATLK